MADIENKQQIFDFYEWLHDTSSPAKQFYHKDFDELFRLYDGEKILYKLALRYLHEKNKGEFTDADSALAMRLASEYCQLFSPPKPYKTYGKILYSTLSPIPIGLPLEINFFEWLSKKYENSEMFDDMTLGSFERIVDDYAIYSKCSIEEKKQLIKFFKIYKPFGLIKWFYNPIKRDSLDDITFTDLYDRYINPDIHFRCFILPLAKDWNRYKTFIRDYRKDIHHLSRDYLDFYISKNDIGLSGYEIYTHILSLPDEKMKLLPCIVIWENDLRDALTIEIEGLSDRQLYELIVTIVENIKNGYSLEKIVEEAKFQVKKHVQQHTDNNRPIINNNITVGSNTGLVVGEMMDSKLELASGSIDNTRFEEDSNEAIKIINSFSQIDKMYRDTLIQIIQEAREAFQRNDSSAKKKCKHKFSEFMRRSGPIVCDIINGLAGLATIASFFGING